MRRRVITAVIIILAIAVLSSCGDNKFANSEESKYGTQVEALQAYYMNERNMDLTEAEISDMTVNCVEDDENYYYIMKECAYTGEKKVPFVYVLGIGRDKGTFVCEKVTADFSLTSPEDINDAEYTPYAEYEIPVADKVVHVGIVFDDEYKPGNNGNSIDIGSDGIYSYISEQADETQ